MRTVNRWMASILPLALLVPLSSCVTYTVTDASVGNMSYQEAHAIAVNTLKKGYTNVAAVKIVSNRIILLLTNGGRNTEIRNLDKITEVKVDGATEDIVVTEGTTQYRFHIATKTKAGKIDLVKAIHVLSRHAIQTKKTNDIFFEDFERSLSDYRDRIASNVELPEEAYKNKIQGEGAVREKDFNGANVYFKNVISVAPWWPIGYFNRALVLSELGEYKLAMRLMKCYLQLTPDAPNARAAQNKIYDWERADAI